MDVFQHFSEMGHQFQIVIKLLSVTSQLPKNEFRSYNHHLRLLVHVCSDSAQTCKYCEAKLYYENWEIDSATTYSLQQLLTM